MGNLIHVFIDTWKMKSPRFGPKMIHKKYDPGTPKIEVWKMIFLLNMKSIHAILVKNPEKNSLPLYPILILLFFLCRVLDLSGGIIFIPMIQENSAGAAGDKTPARWALKRQLYRSVGWNNCRYHWEGHLYWDVLPVLSKWIITPKKSGL